MAKADESVVTGYKVQTACSWLSLTGDCKEITVNVNSDLPLPTDALPAGFPLGSHALPGQQEPDRHPCS